MEERGGGEVEEEEGQLCAAVGYDGVYGWREEAVVFLWLCGVGRAGGSHERVDEDKEGEAGASCCVYAGEGG